MRYFLAFAATLGLVFLLAFLLFHGGGKSSKGPMTIQQLASYATTDALAELTIDGPINADQDHQSVQITVGNNDVTFEQLQGYQGTVVNSQSFANNENAYVNFLFALGHAGFTQGVNNSPYSDERGYCPQGDRYIFQLTQDGNNIERYWASTCGNPKTYLGDVGLTVDLFQAQVPGYSTLTQNIQF